MKDEIVEKLVKLGFEETKTDLWEKKTGKDYLYWDFRKILRGRFYVSLENKKFESALDSKNRDEYIGFREMQGDDGDEKTMVATKPVITISNKNPDAEIVLRGNETDISNVVQSRRLDMIAKASKAMGKDGLGEGVLYHDLGKKSGSNPRQILLTLFHVRWEILRRRSWSQVCIGILILQRVMSITRVMLLSMPLIYNKRYGWYRIC